MRFLNRALHRLESPEQRSVANARNSVLNVNGNYKRKKERVSFGPLPRLWYAYIN